MTRRQETEQQIMQLSAQNAELKAQVATLTAQISTLHAQLNDQNAKIGEHINTINGLQGQMQGLQNQIEAYRNREQAVVYALTEAKDVTARRIAEAEEQARKILQDAEGKKLIAQRQAEAIERDARRQADAIVEDAKREATQTLAQMQDAAKDVEGQLQRLNGALKETAERARRQAEEFAYNINELRMDASEESERGQKREEPIGQSSFDVSMLEDGPEDVFSTSSGKVSQLDFTGLESSAYEDPQKVIQGIYKLQGRSIPEEAIPVQPAPPQAMPQQAQEVQPPVMGFAPEGTEASIKPPVQEGGLNGLLDEIMGGGAKPAAPAPGTPSPEAPTQAPQPEMGQPRPVTQPQPKPLTPQPAEERLWTVDEIIGGATTPAPAAPQAPAGQGGLDSLLDEIMGGGAGPVAPQTQSTPPQGMPPQATPAQAPPQMPPQGTPPLAAPVRSNIAPPSPADGNVDLDSLLDEIIGN